MKKLMIGNEAIARGLYEAGCRFVSSYPGTPSTEITEFAALYPEIKCEWAPNEKVAAESAFGACLSGTRSACAMKHVGLNVAADPLFTMSYTGVNAGMVFIVADDPAMHSSQNEQDSRHYAIAAKLPMLEPCDPTQAKEFARLAFEISEKFDTPVLLRSCTRMAHSGAPVEVEEPVNTAVKPYSKNIEKYVMMPAFAKKKHPIVEARTQKIREYAEESGINKVEYAPSPLGIVTSGTCYQYVKEVFGDSVSVFRVGMVNPLPEKAFFDFASKVERLVVCEELDGIIETHIKSLGIKVEGKNLFSNIGEFSQNIVAKAFGIEKEVPFAPEAVPARPPVMCAGCPHRGLFYTLAKNKLTVLGDIGCYTLGAQAPLSSVDSVLCMGASVSSIHGFNRATDGQYQNKTVAVIGDSTFIHSGITGLINASYNASNSTVIILDNSITGMTGHQQNPTTGYNIKGDPAAKVDLESLCLALGIKNVRVIDPYDLEECDKVIKEELLKDELSVIISRRPCALLKYVKPKAPLKIDPEKCKKCKMCTKIGCPAIVLKNGRVSVDSSLCVGCGVCTQLCKFGAFSQTTEGNKQ